MFTVRNLCRSFEGSKFVYMDLCMIDQRSRRFLLFPILLACILFLTTFSHCIFAESSLTLFTTQEAAQSHCPNDEVVWLNLLIN